MKQEKLFKGFEYIILGFIGVLLFVLPIFYEYDSYSMDWDRVFNIWKAYIPFLLLFSLNHFVLLPYFFFRNKKIYFLIANLLLIIGLTVSTRFVFKDSGRPFTREQMEMPRRNRPPREGLPPHRMPDPRQRHPLPQQSPLRQLPPELGFVLLSILIIGFDTGLSLSVKWVASEQDRVNTEKEMVESQLAFLRNQVSPHFFMNTLNNIHSLMDIDTEEAKESIIRLSKLMRHLLYDSEVKEIPIEKEVQFVGNYIDLMKLRFSDKVKITFDISSELPNITIPPLLFTSYVENAFKHGISYQQESFIHIMFAFAEHELYFKVENSNPKSIQKEGPSGVGLVNSQKRLELLYGKNFELNISDIKESYTVELKIPV
ncbi:sensor histidine kinase [Sediminitomix flava]|uniref:Histidine kinase n=1 Tax=Sediminitomix flava TaxID=379075 RepID=A0A315ZIZ2_SEDFL|nr:histidine kinase [Sediminitomix flava]PWJ45060.1 histidine kinase [Sediminitomix flava]